MKIHELFSKPVERPIEGVIKADDARNLHTEVEEYVVTAEIARGLGEFMERYLNDPTANGVWISGFFGSGKSHLLKILALVLGPDSLAQHPVQHRPEVGRHRRGSRFAGPGSLRQGPERTARLLRQTGSHRPV